MKEVIKGKWEDGKWIVRSWEERELIIIYCLEKERKREYFSFFFGWIEILFSSQKQKKKYYLVILVIQICSWIDCYGGEDPNP